MNIFFSVTWLISQDFARLRPNVVFVLNYSVFIRQCGKTHLSKDVTVHYAGCCLTDSAALMTSRLLRASLRRCCKLGSGLTALCLLQSFCFFNSLSSGTGCISDLIWAILSGWLFKLSNLACYLLLNSVQMQQSPFSSNVFW